MSRALPLVVVLLACGGGPNDASGPGVNTSSQPLNERAGSRLHRAWHSGTDGTVSPAGWFDKTLGTRCEFQEVNGVSVCVPNDVFTLTYKQWGDTYSLSSQQLNSDPDCSKGDIAVVQDSSCAKYGLVHVLPDSTFDYVESCGGQNYGEAWYVATPLPASTKAYYYGIPAGGGQCCSCQPFDTSSLSAGQLVTMVQLSSTNASQTKLVTATLSVDP